MPIVCAQAGAITHTPVPAPALGVRTALSIFPHPEIAALAASLQDAQAEGVGTAVLCRLRPYDII
jgi:hypothetical protein